MFLRFSYPHDATFLGWCKFYGYMVRIHPFIIQSLITKPNLRKLGVCLPSIQNPSFKNWSTPIHFQNIMCQTWHVGYRYHNHNWIIGNWWVISYQQSISAIPLLNIWIDNNTQHSSDHVHRCWASLSPFSAAVPWLPPPSFACWALPSVSAPGEQKDGGTQGKTKHACVEREIIEMFLKLCESFWPKAKTGTSGLWIKVPDLKLNVGHLLLMRLALLVIEGLFLLQLRLQIGEPQLYRRGSQASWNS